MRISSFDDIVHPFTPPPHKPHELRCYRNVWWASFLPRALLVLLISA